MIVRGKHYLLGEVFDFVCAGTVLSDIRPPSDQAPALGSPEHWVTPGLVDIQVNGYAGVDFCSAGITPEQIERATIALADAGVTSYCPTVITNSGTAIEASLRAIAAASESGGAAGARIIGIHLEGPYISAETGPRGTHPLEHVRPPDWDEFCRFQEAAGGRIRMVTLSPDLPGALDFIARAHKAGLIVALGHHMASPDQIRAAVAAGATLSTHLGNGAHAQLPRHPNYIWEQLAADALMASIIVDGHHLPPSVVKTFFRTKTPERLILVSDVVWLAGLAPGRYRFAGQEVELATDNSVRLAGTALMAGSALKLIDAVCNVIVFAGASLGEAVRMAAANPARLLKAADRGQLAAGARADLCLLRELPGGLAYRLDATIAGGEVAYRASQSEVQE